MFERLGGILINRQLLKLRVNGALLGGPLCSTAKFNADRPRWVDAVEKVSNFRAPIFLMKKI
jgi:hypothetical protein